MNAPADYGLWPLVVINSAVFIIFAFSFFKPQTIRDWRSFGAFSAFLVALFTEMYGFPLTIYLLSGWLQSRFPDVDWFAHDSGHLPEMLFGWQTNPHFGPFHLISMVLIGAGFIVLARAWRVLYAAQKAGTPATTGPYTHLRHPQYVAFILIMFGFLFQWPTVLTVAIFPRSGLHVPEARPERGTGSAAAIWRGLPPLRRMRSSLHHARFQGDGGSRLRPLATSASIGIDEEPPGTVFR